MSGGTPANDPVRGWTCPCGKALHEVASCDYPVPWGLYKCRNGHWWSRAAENDRALKLTWARRDAI